MDADEQRRVENFLIVCPLKDIDDGDVLAALGSLIQDHDHLREKLLTEPNLRKRQEKLEGMRPHVRFKALSLEHYHMAEVARSCGSQPYYDEQESMSRIIMPESRIHEVRD